MLIIDYQDTRPIYEQIVDKFQKLILSGVLPPHERMPSVRNLAMELSINPNTIQKAYERLEQKGFIYTVKGKGGFVAFNESLVEHKKEEIAGKLTAILAEAEDIGMSREEIIALIEKEGGKKA